MIQFEELEFQDMFRSKGMVRGPFGGALKKEYFVESGYAVYEQQHAIYGNFDHFRYRVDNLKYRELQRFEVDEGDFIVSCSGTIGKISRVPLGAPKGIINQALLLLKLKDGIDPDYFYYFFNSPKFQHTITESTQGGAMKNLIGMPELRKVRARVTDIESQNLIGSTLRSIDSQIEGISSLISAKKRFKRALMNELLTGKRRFPEFVPEGGTKFKETKLGLVPEDWKVVKLGDVGKVKRGKGVAKGDITEQGYPAIRYGELYTIYDELIENVSSRIASANDKDLLARSGDVLFPISGEKPEDIGMPSVVLSDDLPVVGSDIVVFQPNIVEQGEFIAIQQSATPFRYQRLRMAQGHSVVHLGSKDIASLVCAFPSSTEIERISQLHRELRQEIIDLEKLRTEYSQLKKGVLQKVFA